MDHLYSPSVDHRVGLLCHLRFAQCSVSAKNLSASGFYGSIVYCYWLTTLQKSTMSDVPWLPYMHMGVFLGLPALCFSHATLHLISWYSWTESKTLCLHLTAFEGTPASTSLSHGHNFMGKNPHHRQKNMKKWQIHFSDTETDNRLTYITYYTPWCQLSYAYICSYAVLI